MFKDHGTWGSYEGDVDNGGNRQGKGKMTYVNGCYYEGGFVDDKFHGDKGVYHWFDGDGLVHAWKIGPQGIERGPAPDHERRPGLVECRGQPLERLVDRAASAFKRFEGQPGADVRLANAQITYRGTGDLAAALFLARLMEGRSAEKALQLDPACVR